MKAILIAATVLSGSFSLNSFAALRLTNCGQGDQKFREIHTGDGDFRIQQKHRWGCVTYNGQGLTMDMCGRSNQKFIELPVGDGTFRLKAKTLSNQCMEIQGNRIIYQKCGRGNQKFSRYTCYQEDGMQWCRYKAKHTNLCIQNN